MTINTEDMLNSILESISRIDYVRADEIPNIDLYMDQVTTFMNDNMKSSKRYADDKILTLSTCYGNQSDKRYLVQAVLINIEN